MIQTIPLNINGWVGHCPACCSHCNPVEHICPKGNLMIRTTNLESEYKVKFKVRLKGLFSSPSEGVYVYEAASAQGAIEKCITDFNNKMIVSIGNLDDVEFSVVDVEKL